MTAVIPPRVRPGERVGVCAPAGPIKAERLARGVARLGEAFRVTVAPSLGAPQPADAPPYLAASDAQRADELGALLRDPDVRAIILARGGYGLMRILPLLDPDVLRRDPKPIVGFSDATALLAWAYSAGVRGIHGPMVGQLGELPASDAAHLIALLTEPRAPGVRPWRLETTGSGTVRGPVVPANLTMASLLVATPWPVPLAGAIALFEEVNEKPYELDRYLTQLILTRTLTAVAAVVFGDLTRCTDPAPPLGEPGAHPTEALRTVRERVAAAQKPCAVGAPVGHGARNEAIPFGAASELDLDHGTLAILEPAVA